MGNRREDLHKKGSNKRGCFAASKSRSYFKGRRLSEWKGWRVDPLVPIEVDANNDKLLTYIASKIYDQLRSLNSKPAGKFADYTSIYYNLYWLAEAKHLILFRERDKEGRNVGVLAFDVVTPWYTRYTCLDEIFVLALDPTFHGFGRTALKYMKKRAKALGCTLMETGASMTDKPKLLENLYKRHGKCTFSYPNFVWVLPN